MSEKRESAIFLRFCGKDMARWGIGKRHKKGGVVKNAKSTPPANPQRGLYADGKHLRQFGGVARALVFRFIDLRGLVLGGSDRSGQVRQLGSEQDGVAS